MKSRSAALKAGPREKLSILVAERPARSRIKKREIKRLTQEIVDAIKDPPSFRHGVRGSVSILFCHDDFIQDLNRDYRGKDKPTDVLSFAMGDGDEETPSLGDIVISLETAARQHGKYHTSYPEEIVRLLVHGLHHLLGFDHEGVSRAVAQRMRRSEDAVFALVRDRASGVVKVE